MVKTRPDEKPPMRHPTCLAAVARGGPEVQAFAAKAQNAAAAWRPQRQAAERLLR